MQGCVQPPSGARWNRTRKPPSPRCELAALLDGRRHSSEQPGRGVYEASERIDPLLERQILRAAAHVEIVGEVRSTTTTSPSIRTG